MTTIDRIEGVNTPAEKQETFLQKLVSNNKAQILGLIALACIPIQGCDKINAKGKEIQKEEQQRRAKDLNDFREQRAKELPNKLYYVKDKAGICYAAVDSYARGYIRSIVTVPCEKVEHLIHK
ncbi:hypothetical protein M0P65_02335 [Candidatus Gracilibacteria bacterium]|nr:hypothetical protein [Candidatus Gracilibacteria bacterium]